MLNLPPGSYFFNGFRFRSLPSLELENLIENGFLDNKSIHFVAASTIVALNKEKQLIEKLNANFLIADSKPLTSYLRRKDGAFLGFRGTSFMRDYLGHTKKGFFLIGTDSITVTNLIASIRSVNPDSCCSGYITPDYKDSFDVEMTGWAQEIKDSGARSVWIGMGSPKQDLIALSLSKLVEVPVIAVGAAFDFIAGTKDEAPSIFQTLYLEWFFRFMSEPGRLWYRYTIGNAKFLILIIRDFIECHSMR